MYRRPQFDKVNPRNVLPSRHAIFIRGLPGSTDVGRVKEFFSNETDSKCSVDFFSTSDDRKRFSVAIRFKSHEMARDMLDKYNNKLLFGHPVEITWFKDLKKARAKMFEEQRQSSGRPFQRAGFRGNFRGSTDRRVIQTSPEHYFDNRRPRAGSSSSGGVGYRMNAGARRQTKSRSRSFTGSSSRSNSRVSGSRSPPHRQLAPQHQLDADRMPQHGYPDRQPLQFDNREQRNHQFRSRSGSSASSHSPSLQQRQHSNQRESDLKSQATRYTHSRVVSPPNYSHSSRRNAQPSASLDENEHDFASFSNAPAPDVDGGSSLVSGLIQLKRRNQQEPHPGRLTNRARPSSAISSSSNASGNMDSSVNRSSGNKRLRSVSPPFNESVQRGYRMRKDRLSPEQNIDEQGRTDYPKKKKKHVAQSPESESPPSLRNVYSRNISGSSRQNDAARPRTPSMEHVARENNRSGDKSGTTDRRVTTRNHSPLSAMPSNRWRTPEDESRASAKQEAWSRRKSAERKTINESNISPADVSSSSEEETFSDSKKTVMKSNGSKMTKTKETVSKQINVSPINDNTETVSNSNQEDPIELIRQRKEALAQDYKRDCEAFTTVVRTLISKDAELESRLMPMLKEILQERGQRCIEELRSFIAEHQPESELKNDVGEMALTA